MFNVFSLNIYRMNRDTFNYILERVTPVIIREDTALRRAIPPDQRLAITLWRLATNVEYRTIAGLFGVGLSTACMIVLDTCRALIAIFRNQISIPDGQRLERNGTEKGRNRKTDTKSTNPCKVKFFCLFQSNFSI